MTESSNPYQPPKEAAPPPAPAPGKSWGWSLLMVVTLTVAGVAAFFVMAAFDIPIGLLVVLAILAMPMLVRSWWLSQRQLREGISSDVSTMGSYLAGSAGVVLAIAFAGYAAFCSVCGVTGLFTFQLHAPSPVWPWWVGGAVGWGATIWATRSWWLRESKVDKEQDEP